VLNAAAALVVSGRAVSLRDGVVLAGRAIDDGSTRTLLGRLVEASRS
jgi:anthranilate phosphoribosyltransferase